MGRMDEHLLIEQARAGDRAAFGQLVRLHRDAVYRFAVRWLGDSEHALDVAQDVFVRAYDGLKNYRGDGRFRTWLFSITLNLVRTTARRQKRRGEIRLDTGAQFPDLRTPPDARAARADAYARAARELATLPEKQRGAVTLRIYEGLSFKEIGEIIGCSEGSARVNYHHGIQRLREALT
ncbi:MAG: RNA polymerase sigma factor [Gemmatimonadales bacterium]|jgi:RNA polymerase sigma-70 factor (ECF subfamily)